MSQVISCQTKSLGCQLDRYEIRADGTLWREHYDTEDRSDPNGDGLAAFIGCMTRVNLRWEPERLTGEINVTGGHPLRRMKLWLRDGVVKDVALIPEVT